MPKKINAEFRTVMHPESFDFEIDYRSKMMFIGSCFAENIGGVLKRSKFNTDINPFGILYNPVSVKNTLLNLIDRKIFREKDLFYYNELWNSLLHHGSFSGTDKNETLQKMNERIDDSSQFLKSCDQLFITFGTAWVYEFKKTKTVVSNCHKIPGIEFKKFLLKPKEIIDDYVFLHTSLKKANPKLKFIYSLSPVRHLKDGFSENSLSKAVLRYAISELVNDCEDSYYFPAYEIQTDDLRDYRFYDRDMLHPDETALEYIFQFFSDTFFNDETKKLFHNVQKIIKASEHKPFNKGTESSRKFVKSTLNKIENMEKDYPFLDFSKEISVLLR